MPRPLGDTHLCASLYNGSGVKINFHEKSLGPSYKIDKSYGYFSHQIVGNTCEMPQPLGATPPKYHTPMCLTPMMRWLLNIYFYEKSQVYSLKSEQVMDIFVILYPKYEEFLY